MSARLRLFAALGFSLVLVALVGSNTVIADGGSWIYFPKHRSAEDLLPLAVAALESGGTAIVDAGNIVLLGPASAVAEARKLIELRDIPRPMITLELESRSVQSLKSAGLSIHWNGSTGSIANGLLSEAEATGREAIGSRSLRTSRDEGSRLSVQVLDGETARIELGDLESFSGRNRYAYYRSFVEVTSGITVRPHAVGNAEVLLTLEWHDNALVSTNRIGLARIATTLRIAQGRTVVLGTMSQSRSNSALRRGSSHFGPALNERVVLLRASVD